MKMSSNYSRLSKSILILNTLIVFLLFFALTPNFASAQPLIENGSFETGDFTGWTVVQMPDSGGDWFVYSGVTTPISTITVLPPPDGNFAAITDQGGPSSQVLYQDIDVPPNASIECSLVYYYENNAEEFITEPDLFFNDGENQQARIDILDPASHPFNVDVGVLENLLQTQPGDPLSLGYTTLLFDLTPYAGSTVRLRFAEVDNLGEFNFAVDNITCDGDPIAAQVPTLSEWGLIAMAGILGIAGLMVVRRKKLIA
jgi:hypothetical protein